MTEPQPIVVVSDVFTCDPFRVDLGLFREWTQGTTVEGAAQLIKNRDRQRADAEFFASPRFESLALGSARHQYHFFRLLAEKLERPAVLLDRLELHIPLELHAAVVGCYYAFDGAVARLLVGRKLTANLRKDVDDVASESGVPLTSCLRQYDNFRRVTKAVETHRQTAPTAPTLAFLQRRFCFSDSLAQFVSFPSPTINTRVFTFLFFSFSPALLAPVTHDQHQHPTGVTNHLCLWHFPSPSSTTGACRGCRTRWWRSWRARCCASGRTGARWT